MTTKAINKATISYAKNILLEFKIDNQIAGINAMQAMWIYNRIRAWTFTLNGVSFTVDLYHMANMGDLELCYIALSNGTPDDMTESFHWMSDERIQTLIDKLRLYLGW